jgi:hypothetical protein
VSALLISCNRSSLLEQSLAGDNRAELEKVLAHYAQNPADSLKYRAAVFLIGNMAGYYFCARQSCAGTDRLIFENGRGKIFFEKN